MEINNPAVDSTGGWNQSGRATFGFGGIYVRDGHFQIGVVAGLLDQKHYQAMKESVWLFLWLIHRQTAASGRVLAKKFSGITYDDIAAETGWNPRTVRSWLRRLRETGYVTVKHTIYSRLVVTVCNPKKFQPKQLALPMLSRQDRVDMASQSCRLKQTDSRTNINTKTRATPARPLHAIREDEKRRRIAARDHREVHEAETHRQAQAGAAPRPSDYGARVNPAYLERLKQRAAAGA